MSRHVIQEKLIHEVCCGAAVFNDNDEILIVRDKWDNIGLPKGQRILPRFSVHKEKFKRKQTYVLKSTTFIILITKKYGCGNHIPPEARS